jgi:prophage endopeptidase
LQLNDTCEKQFATRATGMDDAASTRLTDAAQGDYFTLRKRIEVAGKQIAGLQQYINNQCLN